MINESSGFFNWQLLLEVSYSLAPHHRDCFSSGEVDFLSNIFVEHWGGQVSGRWTQLFMFAVCCVDAGKYFVFPSSLPPPQQGNFACLALVGGPHTQQIVKEGYVSHSQMFTFFFLRCTTSTRQRLVLLKSFQFSHLSTMSMGSVVLLLFFVCFRDQRHFSTS
jgi:hypothetical protein